jgi:hypothetical protein
MPLKETLSNTELRRIAEEFMSERDAAKRDTMRAFDERDIALAELQMLLPKCIWDDCDQEAIYCEGHAREYVAGLADVARLATAGLSDDDCRRAIEVAGLPTPMTWDQERRAFALVRAGWAAAHRGEVT